MEVGQRGAWEECYGHGTARAKVLRQEMERPPFRMQPPHSAPAPGPVCSWLTLTASPGATCARGPPRQCPSLLPSSHSHPRSPKSLVKTREVRETLKGKVKPSGWQLRPPRPPWPPGTLSAPAPVVSSSCTLAGGTPASRLRRGPCHAGNPPPGARLPTVPSLQTPFLAGDFCTARPGS